ncbi:MAG: response regulator, partial [Bacteroidales bacterium]|nr:response regulator [Bacteroidales bacterium]
MPVMNGLETTKYIREKLPYPKNKVFVVALTAHNPQLFFEDFKDVGFDRLLTKPYNLEKISMLVEEVKS